MTHLFVLFFFLSLKYYLTKFAYKNAETSDLWTALGEVLRFFLL